LRQRKEGEIQKLKQEILHQKKKALRETSLAFEKEIQTLKTEASETILELQKRIQELRQSNEKLLKTVEELEGQMLTKNEELIASFQDMKKVREDIESLKTTIQNMEDLRKRHLLFMAFERILSSPVFERLGRPKGG
jgi:two-component sensor histidine kinase